MRHRHKLLLVGAISIILALLYVFVGVGPDWNYVVSRRLLKVAAVCLTGASIAASTVIFQTITNNRILTPSIIGMDSLYVLLQTLIVFIFGATSIAWVNASVHFAVSAGFMVLFAGLIYQGLFRRATSNIYFMLLVGLILGVFFQSFSSFLQMLIDPNEFLVVQGRMFASFNNIRSNLLVLSGIAVASIGIYLYPLAKNLDVIALGKDHAINLGVNYHAVVKRLWIVVAMLVAISTALVGPITFLGLLVANVAYQVFDTHQRSILIGGSILLSIATLVGALLIVERVFTFSTTVSVIINFVGSLYFLYIVIKESQP